MIHDCGCHHLVFPHAVNAQWMCTKVVTARLSPGAGVSALVCGASPLGLSLLLDLSVLSTKARRIYQSTATWLPAY